MKVYKSEAEAREDWQTIAPEYRTQERLAEMLAQVRPAFGVAPIVCKCGNDDPDQFTTVVSGGGYKQQAYGSVPGSVNHGSLVLHGFQCMKCGEVRRPL